MQPDSPILVIGAGAWSGAYLLRIVLSAGLRLRFGRFAGGRPIPLAAGDYLYIGSAQGAERHAPLIKRVTRHLQRTAQRPPQRLWDQWQAFVSRQGIHLAAPAPKRLHWHIDYLLDELVCDVAQIILLPSPLPIEQPVAEQIEAMPAVQPAAPGLGATDHPRHTHLLRWEGTQADWHRLLADLASSVARTVTTHPTAYE